MIVHTDEDGEGSEMRKKITYAESVIEQRVTHFVMALGIIGTMTGPLLIVLHTIPRALFAGVFFIVGVRILHFLSISFMCTTPSPYMQN